MHVQWLPLPLTSFSLGCPSTATSSATFVLRAFATQEEQLPVALRALHFLKFNTRRFQKMPGLDSLMYPAV